MNNYSEKVHSKMGYFVLFFTFNLLQITGCNLNTDSSSQAELTISMASSEASSKAHLNSLDSELTNTVSGFDCFGVNVIGYDIPYTNSDRLPSPDLLNQLLSSTSTCTYAGIVAVLPNDTLTTTINVPSGPKRLIQIFGIVDSNYTICSKSASTALNEGAFFEIGRTVTDLYSGSQTVQIDNSYDNLVATQQVARQARCNNGK